MQFPVSIELHRSRLLPALLVAVHAGAAGCVVVLPWLVVWQVVLLASLAASLAHNLRRSPVTALRLLSREVLEAVFVDGRRATLALLPETTVFRWLVVLRARAAGESGVLSVSVLPDQMPSDDFRVLRLWLRWRAEAAGARRAS